LFVVEAGDYATVDGSRLQRWADCRAIWLGDGAACRVGAGVLNIYRGPALGRERGKRAPSIRVQIESSGEQAGGIGVRGIAGHVLYAAHFNDASGVENQDAVGQ
jgi:hypothetical protein